MLRVSPDENYYIDEATGEQYDRVSRVLQRTGVTAYYPSTPGLGATTGRVVHRVCELINKGTLKEGSVDPKVKPQVQGYRDFLRDTAFKPLAIEVTLGSIYGFAGTIDIVGELNSRLVIVDIKTGGSVDPAVEYQAGAYEILWNENNPEQLIQAKFSLHLRTNGKYSLKELKRPAQDFLEKYESYRAMTAA